jgi:thrombospondin motif-containing protein 9
VTCYGSDAGNGGYDAGSWIDPAQCLSSTWAAIIGAEPVTTQSCNTQPCNVYQWAAGAWGTCTGTCGTGTQTRTVNCRATNDDFTNLVDQSECNNAGNRPLPSQSCQLLPCITYTWASTGFGHCSQVCQGTQTTGLLCYGSNDANAVDTALCTQYAINTKPSPVTVACNTQCVTASYSWVTGNYGACSASCGSGTYTRAVYCHSSLDQSQTGVADSYCSNQGSKPATVGSCSQNPCPTYVWFTGNFENCAADCDGATQSRTVYCYLSGDVNQASVPESYCNPSTRPIQFQQCNTQPCTRYYWVANAWGACSAQCASSGQNFPTSTRTLSCYSFTTGASSAILQSSNNLCDQNSAPATVGTCNTAPCQAYQYYYGNFGLCSQNSGPNGVQYRTVQCRATVDNNVVALSQCNGSPQPSFQSCNTNVSPTPNYCVSERNDIWACWAVFGTHAIVDGSNCAFSTNLMTSVASTNSWFTGPWSQCQGNTGTPLSGTQSRSITCRSSVNGETIITDTTQCVAGWQPSTTQSC